MIFPGSAFVQRVIANVTGVVFDASKTTRIYAEDIEALGAEITEIEQYLIDNAIVAPSGGSPSVMLSTCFENASRFVSVVGGTATCTCGNSGLVQNLPAATNAFANTIQYFLGTGAGADLKAGSPSWGSLIKIGIIGSAGSMFYGLSSDMTTSAAGITFTNSHIGFKVVIVAGVASLYATQANATTETASAALTTFTTSNSLDLLLKVNGSASVDYYWRKDGGALSSATNLSTNMPTAMLYSLQWCASVNGVAAAHQPLINNTSYSR